MRPPKIQTSRYAEAGRLSTSSLIEAEWIESLRWLIRMRWMAGVGVLLITLSLEPIFGLRVSITPLLLVGLAILLYNSIFYWNERRLTRMQAKPEVFLRVGLWLVVLDWLAMTFLIHFSGGIESPALFFFFFHIVIASTIYPARIAFTFALLAVGLLSGISLLEFFALLPHQGTLGFLQEQLYRNPYYVAGILVFFNSTALIIAYIVSTIAERLRRREREVVRLSEDLQQASDRLKVLNEGAQTVNSTLELSEVLNRLVHNTAEVMGVQACSIRLLDKGCTRLEPVATYGLSQVYLEKGPIEIESNPLARQVLAGKIINIPDVSQSTLLQYSDWALQEGISSMLSAPLIGKNQTLGILRAYSEEKDHFNQEDETFLAAIAAQGSNAIENALAYRGIEELDANKSTFVRMVTHELRSPVSVIRSLLRTITAGYAGELTAQQRDILERAGKRADFLQKLIDDLLDLAAGKMKAPSSESLELIALLESVQKVVNRFSIPSQEKSLTLEFRPEPGSDALRVMAEVEELDRVFNNLISNAVKYTPTGGRVTITLSQEEGEAQLAVEDTGIGIPEEAMEHLFEEFYRAPNAKALEREGTGLGLAITKDIVTRFGGRMTVQSKAGKGTRFTVFLPIK